MSSEPALRVEGLGKAYTIRHQHNDHVTLAQVALDRALHPTRRNVREQVWALEDVSFEVGRGQVLGVVGRNGAGKSTLLKLLTRITHPTTGRIDLWGRVGSLLEVGTGFHPELTGRENIYLNGSILGMTRREIDRQFDAIVEFAGVERFLDTPVKRYSSGMYVRLAFAVAAHLETEILLLDEVLAVGDASFQERCLAKVAELARSGRTALLVSHNASIIARSASRALLLDRGRLAQFGDTASVLAAYEAQAVAAVSMGHAATARRSDATLGTRVRFLDVSPSGEAASATAREGLRYRVTLRATEATAGLVLSMSVHTAAGIKLGSTFASAPFDLAADQEVEVEVHLPDLPLAPGSYLLGVAVGVGENTGQFLDLLGDIMQFEVAPPLSEDGRPQAWDPAWGSIVLPPASVESHPVPATRASATP